MTDHEKEPLHLVGSFVTPFAGAEADLLEIATRLGATRPVHLWSDAEVDPFYRGLPVRQIRPFAGAIPHGGHLFFGGVHMETRLWLEHARPRRVTIQYNLARFERLFRMIEHVREATGVEPELKFVSETMRDSTGMPGGILRSIVSLAPYLSLPLERKGSTQVTVGRLSRDSPVKHGPDDPKLYRMLAAAGVRMRLQGATCIAEGLEALPEVEILPAGAWPVPQLLGSLDIFFYRTADGIEASGRVIVEAMAAGLPMVVSVLGGYVYLIDHGVNGFLVRTQEQAFEAIMALARDPDLRLAMGQAARARAVELHGEDAISRELAGL